jgi:putative hemolysin
VAPELALVAALVAVNAAFAGTEMALVTLRESQLRRLAAQSRSGATLARLARQPNTFLATIQIGITLAGFLASAAAAVSLAEPVAARLTFLGSAAGPVAVVAVTLALAFVTLVLGELAPKRLAMQRPERWGLVAARPLAALAAVARPAVWLLSHATDLAVRLFGGDPLLHREHVTAEELRDMVAVQPTFTPEQRRVIEGAFEIAERTLGQVLVPRRDVFVLDADWSCGEALDALAASGHSRAPVAPAQNLDRVAGVVHLRQLLTADAAAPVGGVAREVPAFPESARALTALRQLQNSRTQLAAVVDEHGGVAGIVTVEDLVEELVGEIYDETDPDLGSVTHEPDGVLVLPGRFPVHDLPDVGVELPSGAYTTLAGLALAHLGRIPAVGDGVVVDGWHLAVRAMRGQAVTLVALTPAPAPPRG